MPLYPFRMIFLFNQTSDEPFLPFESSFFSAHVPFLYRQIIYLSIHSYIHSYNYFFVCLFVCFYVKYHVFFSLFNSKQFCFVPIFKKPAFAMLP